MATTNLFDLLADDDNDDPSQLIAAHQQKIVAAPKKSAPTQPGALANRPANLPSKPLPPSQAAREATKDISRGGGGRFGGRGFGRGHGGVGFNRDRDMLNSENSFGNDNNDFEGYTPSEGDDKNSSMRRGGYGGRRGGFRGGRRGGFINGEVEGDRIGRQFERRSGTGRGNEMKRDGAGRGNWGAPTDDVTPETEEHVTPTENEMNVDAEKSNPEKQAGKEGSGVTEENPVIEPQEPQEKEPEENKEMTLEEYEKVLEEKRKALLALKTEERKVSIDEDLESMQLLSSKKSDDEIFVKLGSDKDKRKDAAEKEEKAKKSVSINEFLMSAERERNNGSGVRGRGSRGRGPRGGFGGGGGYMSPSLVAPAIDDVGQFPSLAAK